MSPGTCPAGSSFVIYHVEGTAESVSLTIANAHGNTEQAANVRVPVSMRDSNETGFRLGCVPSGQFLYVSAQNRGSSGTVTCEIEAGGRVVSRASSSGGYVIATCDALAP